MSQPKRFFLKKNTLLYTLALYPTPDDPAYNLYFTSSSEALLSLFRDHLVDDEFDLSLKASGDSPDLNFYLNTFVLTEDIQIGPAGTKQSLQHIINESLTITQMKGAMNEDCNIENADGYVIIYQVERSQKYAQQMFIQSMLRQGIRDFDRKLLIPYSQGVKGRMTGYILCRENLLVHAESYLVDSGKLLAYLAELEMEFISDRVRNYGGQGTITVAVEATYLREQIRANPETILTRIPITVDTPGYRSPTRPLTITSPTYTMEEIPYSPRRSTVTSPRARPLSPFSSPKAGPSPTLSRPVLSPAGISLTGSLPSTGISLTGPLSPRTGQPIIPLTPALKLTPSKPVEGQGDLFLTLPREIMRIMALNMHLKDLTNSCQASQRFNQLICEDEQFWADKTLQDFGQVKAEKRLEGMSWKLYYRELTGLIPEENALDFSELDQDLRNQINALPLPQKRARINELRKAAGLGELVFPNAQIASGEWPNWMYDRVTRIVQRMNEGAVIPAADADVRQIIEFMVMLTQNQGQYQGHNPQVLLGNFLLTLNQRIPDVGRDVDRAVEITRIFGDSMNNLLQAQGLGGRRFNMADMQRILERRVPVVRAGGRGHRENLQQAQAALAGFNAPMDNEAQNQGQVWQAQVGDEIPEVEQRREGPLGRDGGRQMRDVRRGNIDRAVRDFARALRANPDGLVQIYNDPNTRELFGAVIVRGNRLNLPYRNVLYRLMPRQYQTPENRRLLNDLMRTYILDRNARRIAPAGEPMSPAEHRMAFILREEAEEGDRTDALLANPATQEFFEDIDNQARQENRDADLVLDNLIRNYNVNRRLMGGNHPQMDDAGRDYIRQLYAMRDRRQDRPRGGLLDAEIRELIEIVSLRGGMADTVRSQEIVNLFDPIIADAIRQGRDPQEFYIEAVNEYQNRRILPEIPANRMDAVVRIFRTYIVNRDQIMDDLGLAGNPPRRGGPLIVANDQNVQEAINAMVELQRPQLMRNQPNIPVQPPVNVPPQPPPAIPQVMVQGNQGPVPAYHATIVRIVDNMDADRPIDLNNNEIMNFFNDIIEAGLRSNTNPDMMLERLIGIYNQDRGRYGDPELRDDHRIALENMLQDIIMNRQAAALRGQGNLDPIIYPVLDPQAAAGHTRHVLDTARIVTLISRNPNIRIDILFARYRLFREYLDFLINEAHETGSSYSDEIEMDFQDNDRQPERRLPVPTPEVRASIRDILLRYIREQDAGAIPRRPGQLLPIEERMLYIINRRDDGATVGQLNADPIVIEQFNMLVNDAQIVRVTADELLTIVFENYRNSRPVRDQGFIPEDQEFIRNLLRLHGARAINN